uniref:Uncharacterized protein n=1 Tax=Anguilla anguilla TaxID=7936 RepID=A0A0E9Q0S5_ANGAN
MPSRIRSLRKSPSTRRVVGGRWR